MGQVVDKCEGVGTLEQDVFQPTRRSDRTELFAVINGQLRVEQILGTLTPVPPDNGRCDS